MSQRDTVRMEYQLNKRELAEFNLRICAESLWRQKKIMIAMLLFLLSAGIRGLSIFLHSGANWHMIEPVAVLLIVYLVFFVTSYALNYKRLVKSGWLENQIFCLENGYVRVEGRAKVLRPCSCFTEIKRGISILMVGRRLSRNLYTYLPIPRRNFPSEEELEWFLELLRNGGTVDESVLQELRDGRPADFTFTFDLTLDRWADICAEQVQISSKGKNQGSRMPRANYWVRIGLVVLVCVNAVGILFRDVGGEIIAFIGGITILVLGIRLLTRSSGNPVDRYKRMIKKGNIQSNILGEWELRLWSEGCQTIQDGECAEFSWEEYCHWFETENTLFFFNKTWRQYQFLPKESLGGPEETAAFFEYFRRLGKEFKHIEISFREEEKRRNTMGTIMVIVGAALLALFLALKVFSMVITSSLPTYENYDLAETTPFVFHREDYPNYMPLEVQIQVLQSLGIQTPGEEEMAQYQKWMEEDAYRAYLEGTPYVGILSEIGYGNYDEETEEYTYNPTVYWFDFEGWDISHDYIDMLNAFHTMGAGEFELGNIEENCQNVDWEAGTGMILVMFHYNKTPYAFEAQMDYDWIDPDMIGFFNEVLVKENNPKRIYVMGDEGQGAILFYNTEEWAEEFYKKTGIELEAYFRQGKEPWMKV